MSKPPTSCTPPCLAQQMCVYASVCACAMHHGRNQAFMSCVCVCVRARACVWGMGLHVNVIQASHLLQTSLCAEV